MARLSVDARLAGTARSRFLRELFGNSAHFPIANVMLELLVEGPRAYLRAADLYTILFASLVQAYALSRWENRPQSGLRLVGNLVGPAVYTLIEALIEGPGFFAQPQHWAYWVFGAAIGLLQALQWERRNWLSDLLLILENVVRTGILFAMYAIFESLTNAGQTVSPAVFLADRSHLFVALVALLVGLSVGLADLTARRYLELLRQTSAQLKTYSEWLLGRDLLNRIVSDPAALTRARQDRTVLFMDVRGFTRWSEEHAPEVVVALLDRYYLAAEEAFNRHGVIKFKYSADEAMAVFADPVQAARAAREASRAVGTLLAEAGLGAGTGVHTGSLVEGLLGS